MIGLLLAVVGGVLAYAIGSISSGYLVGKVYRNVDLRTVGSGSTGATNMLRALGPGAALLVAVLDVLKGVLAVFVATSLVVEPEWRSFAGGLATLAVIVGHCWPAFLEGRGGRGVATGFGALMMLIWPSGLLAAGAFVLGILLTRIVSVGSLAAVVAGLVGYLALGAAGIQPFDSVLVPFLVAAAFVVVYRHRANIARILAGSEPRLGQRVAP